MIEKIEHFQFKPHQNKEIKETLGSLAIKEKNLIDSLNNLEVARDYLIKNLDQIQEKKAKLVKDSLPSSYQEMLI